MKHELNYGHILDRQEKFVQVLRRAQSIEILHSAKGNVAQVKLTDVRKSKTVVHYFEAEGMIKGDIRHAVEITDNIIKKLVTPKTNFQLKVVKDDKTNELCKGVQLHADSLYLVVDDFDVLMDVKVQLDDKNRMCNY